jgi:hypothetical protein
VRESAPAKAAASHDNFDDAYDDDVPF